MASKRARTDLDAVATKRDLVELRTEVRNGMTELRSEIRAQAVHFENVVVTQMRALTELVQSNDEKTQRQFQELEARLGGRISLLEDAVRTLSAKTGENTEAIRKNSEDMRELQREVAGLRHDFNARPEPDELRALEVRVTALEVALKRTLKQR
jgi:hypothetical protein